METIKARKQGNSITLTIPSSFHIPVGTKVEPKLTNDGIFYKFVKEDDFFDFDTDILKDLVARGYEGQDLIHEFEKMKQAIPKAMDKLSEEAKKEPAMTKEEAEKYFGI